jgi:uncharacterized membrane protein YedE/YeeE
LIGLAATLLFLANGRVAGVSGIVTGFLSPADRVRGWRGFFLLGLVGVGVVAYWASAEIIAPSPRSLGMLALAGLLVGAGTRLSGGCTSGHGVCGTSRLSLRSMVATGTFVATGILTVTLLRVFGVAP